MTILDLQSNYLILPNKEEIDLFLTGYYNDPTQTTMNGKQTKQSVHLARIMKFITFCKKQSVELSINSDYNYVVDVFLAYLKDTAEYGNTSGYLKRDCSSLKLFFKMLQLSHNPVNDDKIKEYLESLDNDLTDIDQTTQVADTEDSQSLQKTINDTDLGIPSKSDITAHLSHMFSKQTFYDYQSRIGMFLKFCRKYKLDIGAGTSDDVSQIILKYLGHKLDMKVSFSYLRRANASIKILFDMLKRYPNPSDHVILN